jgi:hypothetical protein
MGKGGGEMKRIIEELEQVKSFLDKSYRFCLDEGVDNKPLKQRIDLLVEVITKLKKLEAVDEKGN